MAKKVMENYQKIQAKTATPGQRVVMVYKGIEKNLQLALKSFGEDSPGKYEVINNAIQLAEKLILELQIALDKENGGEIAENLDSLYTFWLQHLSDGNAEKDVKKIRDVFQMTKEMTQTWSEAERKARRSES